MKIYEINGNLKNSNGIKNYKVFSSAVADVIGLFVDVFGKERMSSFNLLIDNATAGSGHTPIITPIFGKYLIIKLNLGDNLTRGQVIYQLAHELGHYVFYTYYGLNKIFATTEEESICTAISLLAIKELSPEEYSKQYEYTLKLNDDRYKEGPNVLEKAEFKWDMLKYMISILYIKEQNNAVTKNN